MGTIHKSVGIVPNLDKKAGQKVRGTSQESRSKSEKNKPKAGQKVRRTSQESRSKSEKNKLRK